MAREGLVQAIALRTGRGTPMEDVTEAVAIEGAGLDGNVEAPAHRGITFISSVQWDQAQGEIQGGKPWQTRRANVLVDRPKLGDLIGKTIVVGESKVKIEGETEPCGKMERAQTGLRAALTPECRGGVYGRVLQGGAIRVGDTISIVEE